MFNNHTPKGLTINKIDAMKAQRFADICGPIFPRTLINSLYLRCQIKVTKENLQKIYRKTLTSLTPKHYFGYQRFLHQPLVKVSR